MKKIEARFNVFCFFFDLMTKQLQPICHDIIMSLHHSTPKDISVLPSPFLVFREKTVSLMQFKHNCQYQHNACVQLPLFIFFLQNSMITPKHQSPSLLQAKVHRNSKLSSKKSVIEAINLDNENILTHHYHSAMPTYDNVKSMLHKDSQEEVSLPFKLPQIGKKHFEVPEETSEGYQKLASQNCNTQELKRFQANPYLRKYVGLASKEKLTRDNSCSFLNIVSVKPVFRSSTRMSSSKQANLTLNQEKSDKLIPQKRQEKWISEKVRDSDRVKTISYPHNTETSVSKRSVNISVKDKLIKPQKRLSLVPKETLKPLSTEKKKSVKSLKLQKPKQSPNYSEWCMLIGLLDGISSQKQCGQYYKAFVGKGNNSVLVKNIIKNRSWWTICQDQSEAHLYWTQSRSSKYLQALNEGKRLEGMDWSAQPFMKMQLFGNCQSGLSQKIRESTGFGFQKILSKTQRQLLCKSSPAKLLTLDSNKLKIHNHLQFNWNLSNKKALYYNLKSYYLAVGKNPFEFIPETYHIQKEGDQQWCNFLKVYEKKTLWIVKPGENSNRGCGIDVVQTVDQIRDIIKNKSIRPNGKERSHIVQRYLMPYLYNKRKFDIRCYMLVTTVRGNLRCYWYQQGYIRTACKEFTTKNLRNRMIHLTNDAVQKHSQLYGKYESGNKLSFNDMQKYVKNTNPEFDFYLEVYPRMMELATDAIRSTHLAIDAHHREFSFEIFGLDFMIDEKFQTWLIEVNTNPCLELSCPLLARIIPAMVENAFRIAVDPVFPPPKELGRRAGNQQPFENNKFTLIFSSREESQLESVLKMQKLQNIMESEDQEGSICQDQE